MFRVRRSVLSRSGRQPLLRTSPMTNLSQRLATLTARDIMTEKLVLLEETDTIQRAANLFRDQHISGAPVINAAGEPIGLLSVTDIVPAGSARMGTSTAGPRPQTRAGERG